MRTKGIKVIKISKKSTENRWKTKKKMKILKNWNKNL